MAEARSRAMWDIGSVIMSMIYNTNRDPKQSRALKPDDFNPFIKKRDDRVKGSIEDLKIFLRK